MQKGRVRGLAQRGSSIAYGTYAIKTTDMGFITSRQIESARIAINRYMKREGQVWIRIFPDKPITSKPLEVRMGKGKGAEPLGGSVKPAASPKWTVCPLMSLRRPCVSVLSFRSLQVCRPLRRLIEEQMKMSEITGLSDLDLKERIAADREALQKLRFNHHCWPREPVPASPERRDIARMLTELNARKNAKAEEQKS